MKQPLGLARKIKFLPLVGATYFMVAGGPYGLEDLIAQVGSHRAIIVLVLTPIIWSLPTALMVGELAGAVPEEGGYYAWVRRALGPFWGFQEAWLSLVASIFDMAIYPTLFVLYVSRLWPALGSYSSLLGGSLIALCAAWNLRGSRSVSGGAAILTAALLLPFALMIFLAPFSTGNSPAPSHGSLLGAMLVAMWNYMGWDNASTIAGEVEQPQRTYPLAMLTSVALVTLTYVLPVAALAWSGADTRGWSTGSWVTAATTVGGRALGLAVVLGGVISAVGMLNALMMSYSRLPVVLANDGFLPSWFARLHPRSGAPWVAVLACALGYLAALRLGFERLVELDVMLYGLSLILEFAALVALRLKEPSLPRPFRVPGFACGGRLGAAAGTIAIGVPPTILIAIALWEGRNDRIGPVSALWLGALVVAAAPLLYALRRRPAPAVLRS